MRYCYYCGNEMKDNQELCLACGKLVNQKQSSVSDTGGFLWGLLGFFVPIAGLILYLLWRDDYPLNSQAAGLGALINVGMGLSFFVFYLLLIPFVIFVA